MALQLSENYGTKLPGNTGLSGSENNAKTQSRCHVLSSLPYTLHVGSQGTYD